MTVGYPHLLTYIHIFHLFAFLGNFVSSTLGYQFGLLHSFFLLFTLYTKVLILSFIFLFTAYNNLMSYVVFSLIWPILILCIY